jgi:hypothetical protein
MSDASMRVAREIVSLSGHGKHWYGAYHLSFTGWLSNYCCNWQRRYAQDDKLPCAPCLHLPGMKRSMLMGGQAGYCFARMAAWRSLDSISTTGLFVKDEMLVRALWAPSQVADGT